MRRIVLFILIAIVATGVAWNARAAEPLSESAYDAHMTVLLDSVSAVIEAYAAPSGPAGESAADPDRLAVIGTTYTLWRDTAATEPPPSRAATHPYLVESLRLFHEGHVDMATGVELSEFALVDQGAQKIRQATVLLQHWQDGR